MTQLEVIKNVLHKNHELSRAELAQRAGLTREQLRKALPKLLETKEVIRYTDTQGVEWLTLGKETDEKTLDREWKEIETGYTEGYEQAWQDVGKALVKLLRKQLEH